MSKIEKFMDKYEVVIAAICIGIVTIICFALMAHAGQIGDRL